MCWHYGGGTGKPADVETMLRETDPREGPLEILLTEKGSVPNTPRLQTHIVKKWHMRVERKGMC